ncbi:MAG: hypothetical protein KGN00_07120, partial [Chloroflexota bacterium]|nr:hypothetical protein [Chloroflexota bacterium]
DVADRVPIAAWGHTFFEEWSASDLARVTLKRTHEFQFDYAKLQVRATCFGEALGSEFRPSGALTQPVAVKPLVRESADWGSVPDVVPGKLPSALGDQVDCLHRVVDAIGPDVPVIQTLFSPLSVAAYLLGRDPDRVVRELRADPKRLGTVMQKIAGWLVEFAERSVEAGASGVFYAIVKYASKGVLSWQEYSEWVLPYDLLVAERLPRKSWLNMLHLCGDHVYFDLARILPFNCVNWATRDPGNPGLADGQRMSGKAVVGGMDRHSPIAAGTAAEVRAEASDALRAAGAQGVFLAPGCSVSPWPDEKAENMNAMREVAVEFGRG